MRTHWTAKELRAIGVELPAYIPEDATVPLTGVWFAPTVDANGDIEVVFSAPMTWRQQRPRPVGSA